jgi:triosephosphate isomerase
LLAKVVEYAIIGHSERRQNFGETDEELKEKVDKARASDIMPIFCVQNENTQVPPGVKIVAYEPVEAIGTGNPDSPENAQKVAAAIKDKNKEVESVLYGGSVKGENVKSFTSMQDISGVLVGGASLDPDSFLSIIKQC